MHQHHQCSEYWPESKLSSLLYTRHGVKLIGIQGLQTCAPRRDGSVSHTATRSFQEPKTSVAQRSSLVARQNIIARASNKQDYISGRRELSIVARVPRFALSIQRQESSSPYILSTISFILRTPSCACALFSFASSVSLSQAKVR